MLIFLLWFDTREVSDSVFEFQIAQDSSLAPARGANVALSLLEADIVVLGVLAHDVFHNLDFSFKSGYIFLSLDGLSRRGTSSLLPAGYIK